ncbi:hypothetical protein ATANTOWER_013294 [Ataeniobius toweri]|uniref:Uncharacterized protein n=1 Tax=Ataeniobius toweri TaxID=208326 RepID=A0ABU7AG20_9TELE|nr:hypothetical protein [Ataeniobius toweri]
MPYHASGTGSLGQQTQTPRLPSPQRPLPAPPGQPRDIVPPACPGLSPGSPPGGTCLEHLPREASRRHPIQMPEPPELAPLYVCPSRMAELLTLSLRESPATLQGSSFQPLVSVISFFRS